MWDLIVVLEAVRNVKSASLAHRRAIGKLAETRSYMSVVSLLFFLGVSFLANGDTQIRVVVWSMFTRLGEVIVFNGLSLLAEDITPSTSLWAYVHGVVALLIINVAMSAIVAMSARTLGLTALLYLCATWIVVPCVVLASAMIINRVYRRRQQRIIAALHCTRRRMQADDTECAICLDALNAGEQTTTLLCRHAFHEWCIHEWTAVTSSCPLCREHC